MSATKAARWLLPVVIALVISGVGSSIFGYYQSQQLVAVSSTFTSSQSFATGSEVPKVSDYQFEINGTAGTNYSCFSVYVPITYSDGAPIVFDAGQIHATFSTQPSGALVDFWVLSESQFTAWYNAKYCSDREQVPAVFHESSLSSFNRIIGIPEKGSYYFAFANFGRGPASVTITVNQLTQTTGVNYITQTTSISEAAGLGPIFYVGVVVAILGVVVLAVKRSRSPASAREPYPDQAQTYPENELITDTGICKECGASLAANARFCKECGTPVT